MATWFVTGVTLSDSDDISRLARLVTECVEWESPVPSEVCVVDVTYGTMTEWTCESCDCSRSEYL